MKKQTDTFKRLRSVIKDVNGDNRQIIKTMQDQIDYLMEFIDIQGEILEEKTGSRQPELSVEQKKRLAHQGKKLNQFLLGQVTQCFAPKTIHDWYRELIAEKYDSTGENQKKRGRKPINDEIVAEVLRLAVKEYLEYWNHYRPHAGLDGRMVLPYQQDADGEIQEISFLGGMLHGYRRIKQAA